MRLIGSGIGVPDTNSSSSPWKSVDGVSRLSVGDVVLTHPPKQLKCTADTFSLTTRIN